MLRPLRAVIAVSAASSLSGCCGISQSLSALFCGPRKEAWLERSFDTPRDGLGTFLGAVSRDDPATIYDCLAYGYKKALSVGEVEMRVGWTKLKEKVTGLYILDQAEVSEPVSEGPGRVRFTLTLHTKPQVVIEVAMVREFYVAASLTAPDGGRPVETSRIVDSLSPYLRMTNTANGTGVHAELPGFDVPGVGLDEVHRVTAGLQWKIAGIRNR
ncbi:MAG: hypothetical protein H6837_00730 [Planctomycetes bacterium]|nr:hypothetical protein [Planctomycetota bacterium]